MSLTQLDAWQALEKLQAKLAETTLQDLFAADVSRSTTYSVDACGLHLDFSRNLVDQQSWGKLLELAGQCQLKEKATQVFSGAEWNNTEKRKVLHSALRSADKPAEVTQVLQKMGAFVGAVQQQEWQGFTGKAITDIVNIGIGGSDLGPVMVCKALSPYHNSSVSVHFVSNIDAFDISHTLKALDPETTLFIVASKSFTTLETLTNARTARQWFLKSGAEKDISKHFVAVSSNIKKAVAFGIAEENIFPMWDWVGGRFSLWSAIGLPIALATSMDTFNELLDGAAAMDRHFLQADVDNNLPVILSLLEIWYSNFWGAQSQAILPYDESLACLPDYLQQMVMESNGKIVSREGELLDYTTSPVIWGAAGTNGQHSFHQLLHQGSHLIPCDFIVPLCSHINLPEHHQHLVANAFAQITALTNGRSIEEGLQEVSDLPEEQAQFLAKHKYIPGSRPSNVLLMEKLTATTLGSLIALYENKVLCSSIIWNLNAFDQWGVELGKTISKKIHAALLDPQAGEFDNATQHLIGKYHEYHQ